MNKIIFVFFIMLFSAQTQSQGNHHIVDSIVRQELKSFPEIGLVIGIYNNTQTHYYSYGNLSKTSSVKLDSTSLFEIGSATKTFTGLLLGMEIEKGHVNSFDFIDNYLPDSIMLPCRMQKKIRLTDLASHQSGLPNLSNDQYFMDLLEKDPHNPFRFVNEHYIYALLEATDSLKGYRQYQYNNYAYSLLGLLLENIYNSSYENLVKENILKPLGMQASSFSVTKKMNVAGLYSQQGVPQEPLVLNKANPAGGLHSNAVDLITYLKAHLNSKIKPDVLKFTQITYFQDDLKRIGLGWEITDDYFQKDGDTFGNSCLLRYSPKNNTAIVVLSNHQNGQLVRDIMNGVYVGLTYFKRQ